MQSDSPAVDAIDFGKLFQGSDVRPFLIGANGCGGSSKLVIHTARTGRSLALKRKVAGMLREAGIAGRFSIRRHSGRKLDRARSLEAFAEAFRHDRIEHDPTGAFGRAERLVGLARDVRASLGSRLAGVYWSSRWRYVYLVLDHRAYVADARVKIADLADAEAMALAALKARWHDADDAFLPGIRLGFELPPVGLVPVDRKSYFSRHTLLSWLRGRAGVPVVGAILGLSSATVATAADFGPMPGAYAPLSGPAVSEPNGKASVFGGVRDEDGVSSDEFGGVEGSYSIPLAYQYGAQFDALLGFRDGDVVAGGAAHLFWRDPSQGLLGVEGSYVGWDADNGAWNGFTDMGRLGVEGELYLDQLTLAAQAGVQFGDNTDDGLYGRADLKWYASPDLALKIGASADAHRDLVGHVGTEFQAGFAGIPGLTLYADAAAGDDDYYRVYAGVRIYFGTPKSLIDRHRRDDPESELLDQAIGLGTPAGGGGGGIVTPPGSSTGYSAT